MLQTILLATILLSILIFIMAIGLIMKKNGKFPNSHVSGNKSLRDRGIQCAAAQDVSARKDNTGCN